MTPPAGGDQLGLGCTDFYSAGLNGGRPLGRRSTNNGATGDHGTRPSAPPYTHDWEERIVVAEADLIPSADPQAPLYWMEGQYVVRDDARSGRQESPPAPPGRGGGSLNAWLGENGLNNASYREATVAADLEISMTGPTFRELSAIHAWQAVDPEVEIVYADRQTFFVGDPVDPPAAPPFHPDHWVVERFESARRVYTAAEGALPYRYEYAIHNLNSDTSADGFTVDFPVSATFANVGFTDVDHHSGEPYDTTDWSITVDPVNGTITWAATDMGANTNALRWGATFSFYFESDRGPEDVLHTLDLFKIDEPLTVPFESEASTIIFFDAFETGDTGQWSSVLP